MRIKMVLFAVIFTLACLVPASAHAERIKDISNFEGVRENQLIGYGLVVGLDGTGDKSLSTRKSMTNMLWRMGLTIKTRDIRANNTAAVMVTATLPPFARPGTKLDAVISAIAEAKSLQGGTLLLTPLKGPDGKVYALAQGPVSIGGFAAGRAGARVQKNHPTTGKLPQGVIVERDLNFTLPQSGEIRIFLHRPDSTTASSVAEKINQALNGGHALAADPSTINVAIPPGYSGRVVELITFIEGLEVSVDVPARVVINERTGTVVIGEKVRISPVAIAHGGITITIKTSYKVSQPMPFAPPGAETVVVPEEEVEVKEVDASLIEVRASTLGEIVRALNTLGVNPRDLIAILQALKAAGALQAELEVI